jgi:hypothetical protein
VTCTGHLREPPTAFDTIAYKLGDKCTCQYPTKAYHHYKRERNFVCPAGLTSCVIDPSASSKKTECLDTLSSVDSCGGCTSEGAGVDCTSIPNVSDVSCEGGQCQVYSCDKGYKVENGTTCVEDSSAASNSKNFVIGAIKGADKFWNY